jgi:hypothetical protein
MNQGHACSVGGSRHMPAGIITLLLGVWPKGCTHHMWPAKSLLMLQASSFHPLSNSKFSCFSCTYLSTQGGMVHYVLACLGVLCCHTFVISGMLTIHVATTHVWCECVGRWHYTLTHCRHMTLHSSAATLVCVCCINLLYVLQLTARQTTSLWHPLRHSQQEPRLWMLLFSWPYHMWRGPHISQQG